MTQNFVLLKCEKCNEDINIFKIIIPVDLLNYFIKVINFKKIFLLLSIFKSKSNEESKKQILNEKNFETLEKKKRSIYYS